MMALNNREKSSLYRGHYSAIATLHVYNQLIVILGMRTFFNDSVEFERFDWLVASGNSVILDMRQISLDYARQVLLLRSKKNTFYSNKYMSKQKIFN